jgi:hypothetical protein
VKERCVSTSSWLLPFTHTTVLNQPEGNVLLHTVDTENLQQLTTMVREVPEISELRELRSSSIIGGCKAGKQQEG